MKKPCFSLSDFKGFSNIFWLNNLSNCAQMAVFYGYMQFAEQMLVIKWGYTEEAAAGWTPVPWLFTSLGSPLFGALVDKIGHRVTFSNISCIMATASQLWALCVPQCDGCGEAVIPLLLIGINTLMEYNLTSGSLISYSVPPERLGLAFGIVFCFMNVTLAIIPPILGYVQQRLGFEGVCAMLMLFGLSGCYVNFLMWWIDKKTQNGLLQLKNPYEAMGDDRTQTSRSVILSVNNMSYVLDQSKSFHIRQGCYISPSFVSNS